MYCLLNDFQFSLSSRSIFRACKNTNFHYPNEYNPDITPIYIPYYIYTYTYVYIYILWSFPFSIIPIEFRVLYAYMLRILALFPEIPLKTPHGRPSSHMPHPRVPLPAEDMGIQTLKPKPSQKAAAALTAPTSSAPTLKATPQTPNPQP